MSDLVSSATKRKSTMTMLAVTATVKSLAWKYGLNVAEAETKNVATTNAMITWFRSGLGGGTKRRG